MTSEQPASFLRRRWISVVTICAVIAAWELAAHLVPKSLLRDAPIVPSWEFVFGRGLLGISDYWKISFLAPVPQLGGQRTYLGAFLAIGFHSIVTLWRLLAGLVVGSVVGISLGVLLSWSSVVRRTIALPVHFLRMCPLLALIPLFQFWFGTSTAGSVIYVGYGVGVIFVVSTINAISNVPSRYIESARTFGASKIAIYRRVIWPAIWPELFSALFLCFGTAWGAVIGAEYIGSESGLGRMIIWAENFSQTGRMLLMTLFVLLYANIGYALCQRLRRWALRWQPGS